MGVQDSVNPFANDRRAGQRDDMRRLMREVIRDERSLRKNGDDLASWLKHKVLTPERVALAILIIFQFGGRWQRFETDLSAYQERTRMMEAQHRAINDEIARITGYLKDVRALVDLQNKLGVAQAAELKDQASRLSAVATQQQAAPTRRDINAIANQQLLPRLQRIEDRLKEIEARR